MPATRFSSSPGSAQLVAKASDENINLGILRTRPLSGSRSCNPSIKDVNRWRQASVRPEQATLPAVSVFACQITCTEQPKGLPRYLFPDVSVMREPKNEGAPNSFESWDAS